MIKNFVVGLVALLVCVVGVVGVVECDRYNQTVFRCYNGGGIEPYTCFTNDSKEYWNCPNLMDIDERRNWSNADRGFYLPSTGQMVSMLDLDYELDNVEITDDYYNVSWVAYFKAGRKEANITVSYRQNWLDDYVNERYELKTFGSWGNFNKEVWFWKNLKKINVELDNDIDVINYYNWTNPTNDTMKFQGFYLNLTSDKVIEGARRQLNIMDFESGRGFQHKWTNNSERTIYLDAQGQDRNANVWWYYKGPRNLTGDFEGSINEWWIDADACTKACDPGCSFAAIRLVCAATDNARRCYEDASGQAQYYAKAEFDCFFGTGGCSYGNGCYLQLLTNRGVGTSAENNMSYKTHPQDEWVVCNQQTTETCKISDWLNLPAQGKSLTQDFNITCRSWLDPRNRVYFIEEDTYSLNNRHWCVADDENGANVSLLIPENNSENEPGDITLESKASVGYWITNMTLYHNLSGTLQKNITEDLPLYPYRYYYHWNITIPFYEVGQVSWVVEACDTNWVCKNTTYNWTFSVLYDEEAETPGYSVSLAGYDDLEAGLLPIILISTTGLSLLFIAYKRRKNANRTKTIY